MHNIDYGRVLWFEDDYGCILVSSDIHGMGVAAIDYDCWCIDEHGEDIDNLISSLESTHGKLISVSLLGIKM